MVGVSNPIVTAEGRARADTLNKISKGVRVSPLQHHECLTCWIGVGN